MSMEHRKHGVIDQGKYKRRASNRKWTYREYHVQDNADVAHKEVKMYCNTNRLPALTFGVLYPKPLGIRVLSKHYHSRLDQKLGHGICTIFRIPCACFVCTSMIDQPWIIGISSEKQAHYQPVTHCTYWPVLG